tara:strand:- start:24 stop:305 length:282 start_codon:yes stop_codon:yes gene_type:complete
MKKLVNGELVDMTDAEIAEVKSAIDANPFNNLMRELRELRNSKLQQTDWTQAKDVNLSNADEWTTYRQSLRDITNGLTTVDDVKSVTWPTKPN